MTFRERLAEKPEAIIADDMTGAGDSGVHFALAGKRTAMLLDHEALAETLRDHETVAVSSESRFLSPAMAATAVRGIADRCRRAGVRVVFKKVDSTLRGNPGAEIAAILEATGRDAALVCAAMPKTGRACLDGVLLLHGKPVSETDPGRDPFNPVTCSDVSAILAAGTSLPIGNIGIGIVRRGGVALREAVAALAAAGKRIIVADAATDADLAALGGLLRDADAPDGQTGLPSLLPVGAGGLAEAYNGGARIGGGVKPRGKMLAVIGSLTAVTMAQARYAEKRGGFHVLEVDMESAFHDADAEISRLAGELPGAGKRCLLLKNRAAPCPEGGGNIDAGRAAGVFGKAAKALFRAGGCSVLYVTGGDTARAVAAAFGLRHLTLEGECMPGVVLSSCSCGDEGPRWFISKSGGFGPPDTIVELASGLGQPANE